MRRPRAIQQAETGETKALSEKASSALFDRSLSDDQADAIISDCNSRLTALGMPSGGLTMSRADFRAAWGGFRDVV